MSTASFKTAAPDTFQVGDILLVRYGLGSSARKDFYFTFEAAVVTSVTFGARDKGVKSFEFTQGAFAVNSYDRTVSVRANQVAAGDALSYEKKGAALRFKDANFDNAANGAEDKLPIILDDNFCVVRYDAHDPKVTFKWSNHSSAAQYPPALA